jgi:methylthioribulose 1-phosphate dehydratase/enolase-phosphatase E1
MNAVMCTLAAGDATEFVITHQEMIKGIAGHGFLDGCVVPIIENTPHECDLADSLGEAMRRYPRSNAVLVRRHGVYVWGSSWEAAKTQAECYHYLFEVAVKMRGIGIDPAMVPHRVHGGIGADKSYGSGKESYAAGAEAGVGHVHNGSCCGGAAVGTPSSASSSIVTAPVVHAGAGSGAGATGSGFHGAQGTSAMQVDSAALQAAGAAKSVPHLSQYSHVLLDIEGCTTSISYVTEVLFPYAASHASPWLTQHWGSKECQNNVLELVHQSKLDVASGVQGAGSVALTDAILDCCMPGTASGVVAQAVSALVANIHWQMKDNRKTTGLKQLQGHIWRDGYSAGELHGHLYDDTLPALQAWHGAGKRVYIYSSGSREAQRLLFKNSVHGDVRGLLAGYFDTTSGPKVEAGSYSNICQSLGVDAPSAVLFATDSLAEAVAAGQAGVKVVLTDRPGNAALQAGQPFPVVTSLLQVTGKSA